MLEIFAVGLETPGSALRILREELPHPLSDLGHGTRPPAGQRRQQWLFIAKSLLSLLLSCPHGARTPVQRQRWRELVGRPRERAPSLQSILLGFGREGGGA